MNNQVHVRKGDKVIVISGDDKGKIGKVIEVSPEEGKIIVEGINLVQRHVKPRRQGEKGGIVEVPAAMYADKVMHYCDTCKKGVRAKAGEKNGKKIKVCAKCGAEL